MDNTISTDNPSRLDHTGAAACATCDDPIAEPFGWCSQCRMAFCLSCGRTHFCHASCRANGCIAGFCVRLVLDGELAERWGLPDDEEVASMLLSERSTQE